MARIEGRPSGWHPLPPALAAELGLAVAGFGYLEDTLKRAIFALERAALPGAVTESAFRGWLARMDHVAADSLGALIDRLRGDLGRAGAAGQGANGDAQGGANDDLLADLAVIRDWRNLLCHAVWRPAEGGGWQPVFADNRGALFRQSLDGADLAAIRGLTLDAAARIGRLILDANDEGLGGSD